MQCLVTKLKAASSNPDLPKWREINLLLIKNVANVNMNFQLQNSSGEDIVVTCDENATFNNSQRTITISGGSGTVTLGTLTGDTIIKVSPYSDIIKLYTSSSDVSGGTGLGQYMADDTTLSKLKVLEKLSIRTLTDLHKLNVCENIKYLGLQNSASYDSSANGSLSALGSLVKLQYLYTKNSDVSGSLEDLAAAQVAAGRMTGSLYVQCNGHITLGGVVVGNSVAKTITFNSSSPGGYTIS